MKPTVFSRKGEKVGQPHHYRECGLETVWLANGYLFVDSPVGRVLEVRDAERLFDAIAFCLVAKAIAPGGKELRYLRQRLGVTQKGLGKLVGLSEQQVARWEKGGTIVPAAWRLLRLVVLEHLGKPIKVRETLAASVQLSVPAGKRMIASRRRGHWIAKAA